MALRSLSPEQLAASQTVYASFMGCAGTGYKTFADLLEIYRERAAEMQPAEDRDHDLRVERFMRDMSSRCWRDEVVVRMGIFGDEVLVVDGIHRGLAYLGCVARGVAADRLPALCVEC